MASAGYPVKNGRWYSSVDLCVVAFGLTLLFFIVWYYKPESGQSMLHDHRRINDLHGLGGM